MSEYNIDILINQLKKFISLLIIKNEYIGNSLDKIEHYEEVANFITSKKYQDPKLLFESFTYTPEEQKEVGIEEPYQFSDEIPHQYHIDLVNNKIKKYNENYIEYNNYYRMLNGEPELEIIENNTNIENIKLNKVTDSRYAIKFKINNEEKYFWQLNESERNFYIKYYLDDEIKKRKQLELVVPSYMKYLKNPIDYYTARNASNFYILYYDKTILPEEITKRFIEIYYDAVEYINTIFYNDYYKTQSYYNDFMIIVILFITINKILNEKIITGIKREFFDLESIKNMFESYNLPFFKEIPISFQQKILKNINKLIQYKGTNKVIIDIVKLFGFNDIKVFRYFLVKSYKGIQFVKTPIEDKSITKYLKDESYYEDYHNMISGDPYWGSGESDDEEDFLEELNEIDFNYVSSKYISIDTIKDIYKTNIDIIYFFNTLKYYESKGLLEELSFKNTILKPSGSLIKLYDIFIGIYILTCWYYNSEDLVIYDASSYGEIYGFNFNVIKEDLEEAINYLKNSNEYYKIDGLREYLKTLDPSSIEYIETKNKIDEISKQPNYTKIENLIDKLKEPIETSEELIENFFNNQEYKNYLEELILSAPNYKVKKSLQQIYDATMYTKYISTVVGTGYDTFSEYLYIRDIEFYNFIQSYNNTNKNNIKEGLTILFDEIEKYINNNSFKDLSDSVLNLTQKDIIKYLMSIISIFKAFTVDLKKINTFFMLNNKYEDKLYLYFELEDLKKSSTMSEYFNDIDDLFILMKTFYKDDSLVLDELIYLENTYIEKEKIEIVDKLLDIIQKSSTISEYLINNDIFNLNMNIKYTESLNIDDLLTIIVYRIFKINLSDNSILTNKTLKKGSNLEIIENYSTSKVKILNDTSFLMTDYIKPKYNKNIK